MSKAKRVRKPLDFTVATTTVAAFDPSVADEKLRYKLSTKQFGQQLSELARQAKEIKRLALEVGKRGTVTTKSGTVVDRKGLTKLLNDYIKSLRTLKTNYSAQARKKPRSKLTKEGKPRRAGKGLSGGVFIDQPLKDFFANANYGARTNEVRNIIAPLLAQNVISRAIVTPLITLWKKQNSFKVMEDGKEKSYIRADDAMVRHLGPYLTQLEQTDAAKPAEALKGPRFSRDKFVYARLQSIVNPGMYKKAQLQAEQLAYLDDKTQAGAAVQSALDEAQAQISAINKATA